MPDRAAEYRQQFNALVQEHGWATQGVLADPPALYTVGVGVTHAHPELVICGLDPTTAHGLLSELVHRIAAGETFADGQRDEGLLSGGLPVLFHRLDQEIARQSFSTANWWYRDHGRELPEFLQMLWPDPAGVLPGEPGCEDRFVSAQRLMLR